MIFFLKCCDSVTFDCIWFFLTDPASGCGGLDGVTSVIFPAVGMVLALLVPAVVIGIKGRELLRDSVRIAGDPCAGGSCKSVPCESMDERLHAKYFSIHDAMTKGIASASKRARPRVSITE